MNLNKKMSETNEKIVNSYNELISEKELYEIFEFQYDDLFCKILKINEKSFTYFLKHQVLFNLQIIKRNASPEILTAYLELFIKRYKENLKTVKKNFDLIKEKEKTEENDLTYLDITKCYIHCCKCFNIIHKCGKKLVLYDEYIYCIKCNNVYNKNQILLFCQECNKNYLSKLRKPVFNGNKKFEKLFLLRFKKYHCKTNKEEKIKCIKCSNNLYFRLSQSNSINENDINIIYCIKCKLKYSIKDVLFKCKICLQNFKSEAKLFRDFPSKKKKLLFTIHTLLRNKNALPDFKSCQKSCNCELKKETEYFHYEDNGKLLEGLKNNKTSVVCAKCFKKFKSDEISWNCPKCGLEFKYKNDNSSKNIINQSDNNSTDLGEEVDDKNEMRKIPVFKVNLSKINPDEKNNEGEQKPLIENGAEVKEVSQKKEKNVIKNIKIVRDKNEEKLSVVNIDNNIKKAKKILINEFDLNKKDIKKKYALRKSRSKNDIDINRYKINNNINNNENMKKKVIKLPKSNENLSNKNNWSIENKNNKFEFINNEKNISNEKNLSKANIEKKEKEKKIDTKEIFNQIIDNIYNIEEPLYLNSPMKENIIKNKISDEKKEKDQIKPRHKNTQYIDNNELNMNKIYKDRSLYINEEDVKKGFNKETKINDINDEINRKIQSTGNFDNMEKERKEKRHVKYVKKIYLYNGRNSNRFKPNNLYQNYMQKDYFNSNNNLNLYENNDEFLYSNDTSFQNFDSYYMIDQNNKIYQTINLYNFSSENFSTIKLLGRGANGKIYLVSDMQTGQKFALKTMLIDNEFQLKTREDEYNLVYRLTYENPELKIVNIYGLEVRRIDKFNIFFNVLMEAAISDWEVEIISRKKRNKYYTEEELLYILTNLINTLSFLQQKKISHRDLKPQNILYFGNNEYKICDFGEAKYNGNKNEKNNNKETNLDFDDSNQTIRGTELYMSPILFKAVKYKPNSLTKYNSFKSDVFSLGLCLLHASSLDTNILYKIRQISDMTKIVNIVNNYLGRMYSQNFINLILHMLQIDENIRPDFIELNSWMLYGNN